jgi:hypothetical protein
MSVSPPAWRNVRLALAVGAMALVCWPVIGGSSTTKAQTAGEAQVKAAFLVNFTKFIQWPERTPGPIVIGVAADAGFEAIVRQTVKRSTVDGRGFVTRRLTSGDDPAGCDIVFISAMHPGGAAELLHRISGPILTVGETVQFLRDGGAVRLFVEDSKVRFQIDQSHAERAGLKVSARLMMLSAK